MKCNQVGCEDPPAFRFTWPGKDEAHTCAIHAMKMQSIVRAMGLHLQCIPLTAEDYMRDAQATESEGRDG